MKKLVLTLTGVLVTLLTIAQSPNLFNYQGVARNAVGNVLPSQPIGVRLSILTGSPTGTVVYSETRNVPTNAFGLFNIQVGSPGAITSTGTIAGINWTAFGAGSGAKYLKVEIDPIGGTNYVNAGTTQLVSVPYALNAGSAAPIGPAGGDLTGTYPNPQILIPLIKTQSVPANPLIGMTNSSTTGTIGAIQGISASNDANANGIWGMISSTSPGGFSTGIRGTNNGTGGLGIGVTGTQNGSGWGVYGTTPSGIGVHGNSASGFGVYGLSTSGVGTYGLSSSNNSGLFQNTTAANTAVTLMSSTNGVGDAVSGVSTGTGRGGYFQVNNAASTADALRGETNGTGASWAIRGISSGTNGAGLFQQTNATNTSNNLQSNQAGLGRAGLFNSTNVASTANALEVNVAGAGAGLVSNTTGTGSAAIFNNTNAGNLSITNLIDNANLSNTGYGNNSVYARRGATGGNTFLYIGVPTAMTGSSSTGIGVQGTSETSFGMAALTYDGQALNAISINNGSAIVASTVGAGGITGDYSTQNAANINNVIRATNANATAGQTNSNTGGGNAIFGRKGAGLGTSITNPAGIYGTSSAANGIGVTGVTLTNIATFGGAITTGVGVYGQTFGTGGTAIIGNGGSSATSYGLVTVGRVQIQGQGAALNRVLASDAVGNATWQPLGALGVLSGGGTLNYVPKWTPDGFTVGNSQLFDNGTNMGYGTTTPNARFDIQNPSATRGMFVNQTSTTSGQSGILVYKDRTVGGSDEGSGISSFILPVAGTTYTISNPVGIKGFSSPTTSTGFAGGAGVQGSSSTGLGVLGLTDAGTALYGYGVGAGSYGLQTLGRVQIQGQGAAAGNVLTSDAAGNATWQANAGGPNVGIGLRRITALALPNTTLVPVTQWQDVMHEDGGANYNSGTGQYTITVAGTYQINAAVALSATSNGFVTIQTYVNGSFDNENPLAMISGQWATPSVNYLRKLNVGDTVSVSVYQSSGGAQNISGGLYANNFSLRLIR